MFLSAGTMLLGRLRYGKSALRHGIRSGRDRSTARIWGKCLAACTLEAMNALRPSLGMKAVLEEKPILVLRVAAGAQGRTGMKEARRAIEPRGHLWRDARTRRRACVMRGQARCVLDMF